MTLIEVMNNKRIIEATFNEEELAQIRNWRAIAQAVDLWDAEVGNGTMLYTADLRTLADELLRGEDKP